MVTRVARMSDHLEFRSQSERQDAQFAVLRALLGRAKEGAPGWRDRLASVDPDAVDCPESLARLPVLRKSELTALQVSNPPFGGLTLRSLGGEAGFSHLFVSPGPIFEPGAMEADMWRFARALRAAGFTPGDLVLNGFSYHLTPAGAMLDAGLRTVGAVVLPAGSGNTDGQADLAALLRPAGYVGTPDFLKIILERGEEKGLSIKSFRRALVTGGALFPTLRQFYLDREIRCRQCYGTADLGLIAYESDSLEGMITDEDVIVEIVRPGTGDPVPEGEVGEVVVTALNPDYPLFRFATGDLSAILPGQSSCGRTAPRIHGWMGRADQSTKVRGLFLHPSQVAEVRKRIPELGRLRAVVSRRGERDELALRCEHAGSVVPGFAESISEAAQTVFRLRCTVEVVPPGSLPNDGIVIADERDYGE